MKGSAVNTDTQQAHYPFETKITVAGKLEQEKEIVRDAFPFWAVATSTSGNDLHTGHTARRPDSVPGGPEAHFPSPRLMTPTSTAQFPLQASHQSQKNQTKTKPNKKPKRTTAHLKNTQPSVCPYEGRTPKSVNRSARSRK